MNKKSEFDGVIPTTITEVVMANPLFYFTCVVLFMGFIAVVSVIFDKTLLEQPTVTNGYQVPELWIDPETNCQYFRVTGGITPRLGTDGFPLCNFELPVGSE